MACYYFETFVIVTGCKQPQAMLCQQRWWRGKWPCL